MNAAFGVAIAAEKRWCPAAAPVGAASYARWPYAYGSAAAAAAAVGAAAAHHFVAAVSVVAAAAAAARD